MKEAAHKKTLFISILLAVSFVMGGYFLIQYRKGNILLVSPKRSSVKEVIYGIGTVQARQKFSFKVGLAKTVESVAVQEGDAVKKGDLLLRLTDGLTIRSPLDGIVVSLPFHAGENVFSDQPVIEVQDLRDRYITANLEQQGALRVKIGMTSSLSFESLRQEIFKGKIQSVYPKNGQFVAHIEVEKMPEQIIPGMTADVGIEVAEKDQVLLVPLKALNAGMITVQRGGRNLKIPIQTGVMDQEWIEVVSGDIQDTDLVLVPKK